MVDYAGLEEFLLLNRSLRGALKIYALSNEMDDHPVDVKRADFRIRQKTHASNSPLRV